MSLLPVLGRNWGLEAQLAFPRAHSNGWWRPFSYPGVTTAKMKGIFEETETQEGVAKEADHQAQAAMRCSVWRAGDCSWPSTAEWLPQGPADVQQANWPPQKRVCA